MITTGINGFGRFGMHLLRYWLANRESAKFSIDFINDEALSIEQVAIIINADPYLDLRKSVSVDRDRLLVTIGTTDHVISYTSSAYDEISWLGKPDIYLECSGAHSKRSDWSAATQGSTKMVLISATSWEADQILVYGYNHKAYKSSSVLSYGSCTVNAYIPLAAALEKAYGILDSDVAVIHNVPHHRLKESFTLERKSCTLEAVAPELLPFITDNNFKVTYTLVPYDGVSIIDFRFRLKQTVDRKSVVRMLNTEIDKGILHGLYALAAEDAGPEQHKFTAHSAVLIEPGITMIGDNLYIHAYFDNENSVNRYFDLINYLSQSIHER